MRVLSAEVNNFASYEHLVFDFANQGLALIQGATGSGKSTLCDIVPWVLFGITAKNGAVDEVISWPGDKVTSGTITLEIKGNMLTVTRKRGKSKDNDLYFYLDSDIPTRGKDLNDTQKMINTHLGVNSSLYLASSYFHEFSQTAQFFTTTTKNRRAICDQLVDLSLAVKLQARLAGQKQGYTKIVAGYLQKIQLFEERIRTLNDTSNYEEKAKNFETDKAERVQKLSVRIAKISAVILQPSYFTDGIKEIVQAIANLPAEKCKTCGTLTANSAKSELEKMKHKLELEQRDNSALAQEMKRLIAERSTIEKEENTYQKLINESAEMLEQTQKMLDNHQVIYNDSVRTLEDTELLLDIVSDYRSVSIKNTIQQLEDKTNQLLTQHYDAEIRVTFSSDDAEKLEVTILKNGNLCAYSQLSKGQRQLLKLCFGVSVMRIASNYSGVRFNNVFLDEAMDGLDDVFKIKTYRLLEELSTEYESVFVVDHNENLKAMFINKFNVELVNGGSVVEKA